MLIINPNSPLEAILQKILLERARQVEKEGYTPEHDDGHTLGQLALLAAAYAMSSRQEPIDGEWSPIVSRLVSRLDDLLKYSYGWSFKPKDPIRDLVRAGALIIAELERRFRAEQVFDFSKATPCAEMEFVPPPPRADSDDDGGPD